MAKMGELKRAAKMLGITSSTLRQQGWSTASPERVQAVIDDPPHWLIVARENRRNERAKQQKRRVDQDTASRLGIAVRVVSERGISPADVEGLLAAPSDWLLREQQRQQAQIERHAKDELRRDLTDTLITSVHEAWFQELKHATTDAEVDAIDARWTPEVGGAKREARRLVDELTPEQVQARIDREDQASREAARYRATRLARRVFGDASDR
jgi:hypothetical protein